MNVCVSVRCVESLSGWWMAATAMTKAMLRVLRNTIWKILMDTTPG